MPFVRLEKSVLGKLSRTFRPEFVGRFTDKIVFKPLSLKNSYSSFRQKGSTSPNKARPMFGSIIGGPSYNRAFVRQWDLDYNSFVYV